MFNETFSVIFKLRELGTVKLGIFAQCEQCLWKIYHVYNLIVCRMTGAVPPLLWYQQNFFAFTTKKTFGSLLLYLSLVFFCCKTNRKSNWQLSWEMKGTKSFLKKSSQSGNLHSNEDLHATIAFWEKRDCQEGHFSFSQNEKHFESCLS